jgi:tetratricopeptide (TPR) repeat protein
MTTVRQAMLANAQSYLETYRELRNLHAASHAAEALDVLIRQWLNIRLAQSYAASLADCDDEAASICSAFAVEPAILFYEMPLDWVARQWLQPALAAAERLPDHQENAARHLMDLGNVAQIQGNHNEAITYYQKSLDNNEKGTDVWGQAYVLEKIPSARQLVRD